MDVEQRRTYRLYGRGGPGLACDADGVTLGGATLVGAARDERGGRLFQVRSADELGRILDLAYGPQSEAVIQRCHRGLRRVAARLEEGDLAGAGIEAVMLRIPQIDADGLRKLAAVGALERAAEAWWEDEPRVPAGSSEGGQWTTGGAASGGSAGMAGGESSESGAGSGGYRPDRRNDGSLPGQADSASQQRPSSNASRDDADEITVSSHVRQYMAPNANGFFPNSAGGGVFYIPSTSDGREIRPTEVHALDANAFRVGWTNDTIVLTDRAGRVVRVSANDLAHFNATTGQILGVSIDAFPGQPLGEAAAPLTPAEQQQLANDRANLEAGEEASERSLSGRLVEGGVVAVAALPLIALAPAFSSAVPRLWLNSLEANELPIFLARRLGLEGEEAVGITSPKAGIRIPGTGQLRIPDGLDKLAKVLTEVKNVAKLDLTPQLRDFLAFCRANGYTFRLYIRPSTNVAPALKQALDEAGVKPAYIPGAK